MHCDRLKHMEIEMEHCYAGRSISPRLPAERTVFRFGKNENDQLPPDQELMVALC